jgi:hypothetical protein
MAFGKTDRKGFDQYLEEFPGPCTIATDINTGVPPHTAKCCFAAALYVTMYCLQVSGDSSYSAIKKKLYRHDI